MERYKRAASRIPRPGSWDQRPLRPAPVVSSPRRDLPPIKADAQEPMVKRALNGSNAVFSPDDRGPMNLSVPAENFGIVKEPKAAARRRVKVDGQNMTAIDLGASPGAFQARVQNLR